MRHTRKVLILFCLIPVLLMQAKAQAPNRSLDYFLQKALRYSPVLTDYRNQQQSVKIDSLLIKASGLVRLSASTTGIYAPVVKGYGYDEVLTNGQALEALLNVNYDLLNKKRISNQLEGLRIQADSIKYAVQLSVNDLKKAVTDQYISVYASQQQVDFNRDIFTLLAQEDVLLKKMTQSNAYKQSEYLTFLVTFHQQQLQLRQAEQQLKNDYATLNYLTGITDTTAGMLVEPVLTDDMPKGRKFFTMRFDIDSLKNLNQIKALDLNYRPKLGVYANGGYNSSFVLQPYRNFGASVGFTFSVPIYDGHQRKMMYDKIGLSVQTSRAYKDFFIRQQRQQIDQLRQQIAATNDLFGQIYEQIRLSKALIEVDSRLLRTGDVRIGDFVVAINNYMAAQNLLRQTKINRLKLISQLNYWNK